MFCAEEKALWSHKMREIKIRPVPIANVSCHNDDVWETKHIALEAVIKTAFLAFLASAALIANLLFVLVLRSHKYQRHVHVQVIADTLVMYWVPSLTRCFLDQIGQIGPALNLDC